MQRGGGVHTVPAPGRTGWCNTFDGRDPFPPQDGQ